MCAISRVGLICTGQGPRHEYIAFHEGLLKALGVDIEIVTCHALDGLSPAEIQAMAPQSQEATIHAYVRSAGETNERFGPGWGEAWIERNRYVPLVQACVDTLEEEEQVAATIWCCGEIFPQGKLRSRRPLVMPSRVVLGYAEAVVRLKRGRVVIRVFAEGDRQREQQLELWHAQPWATDLTLLFEDVGDAPLDAAKRVADAEPAADLLIYWGYGVGLAPGDPVGLLDQMESILGAPIIAHHIVSTLFVRNLLYPSIDGRAYVEAVAHR